MRYRNEIEMYPDVIAWLGRILRERFSGAEVDVRDTHAFPLNEYVKRNGLQQYFQSNIWQTFEIRVDITAFMIHREQPTLVFVECKIIPISLLHVSQLLGYSRVARPLLSYLISTKGIGSAVMGLISRYDRTDILEYEWHKGKMPSTLVLGTWNISTKSLEPASVLPPGVFGENLCITL